MLLERTYLAMSEGKAGSAFDPPPEGTKHMMTQTCKNPFEGRSFIVQTRR